MPSVTEDEPMVSTETEVSPTASTASRSSKDSYASSFAYLLRGRRSDTRLLHKSSQPPQHQEKRPSPPPSKRANAARTSSYYRPKIVEDTLTTLASMSPGLPTTSPRSPIPTASPVSVPSTMSQNSASTIGFPFSPTGQPRHSNEEHFRQGHSPARRVRSHSPVASPDTSSALVKRPKLRRSDSPLIDKRPPPDHKKLRIDLPPALADRDKTTKSREEDGPDASNFARNRSTSEAFGKQEGPFTPFEIKGYFPRIGHGEHYFRTFGEETVYEKPRPVVPHKAQSEHSAANTVADRRSPRTELEQRNSDRTVLERKSQRRKKVLLSMRDYPLTDSTLEVPKNPFGIQSPFPSDLRFLLSSSRRTRSDKSDNSGSSYFGLRRRYQSSSEQENLTSPPVSNSGEAATVPVHHSRESSEPLSPTASQPSKLRWASQVAVKQSKEKPVALEQSKLPQDVKAASAPSVHSPPIVEYRSSDGRMYQATSLTAPDAPNFLPSEMKRIDTPPLKEPGSERHKTLRAWKSFFFDVGSLPEDENPIERRSSRDSARLAKRYAPIVSKASLQSLIPKLSMPRLRPKGSHASDERRESDPLAVTDFQQTPFSQRYGDARRAKQTLMRAYIWDETLRDDDTSFGSVEPLFELNIPDHLTSSPLCPLNEKHRSGGKAICPIHGRKKMVVNAYPPRARAASGRDGNRVGRREPTIVFESSTRGNGSVGMGGNYGDESRRTSGML